MFGSVANIPSAFVAAVVFFISIAETIADDAADAAPDAAGVGEEVGVFVWSTASFILSGVGGGVGFFHHEGSVGRNSGIVGGAALAGLVDEESMLQLLEDPEIENLILRVQESLEVPYLVIICTGVVGFLFLFLLLSARKTPSRMWGRTWKRPEPLEAEAEGQA